MKKKHVFQPSPIDVKSEKINLVSHKGTKNKPT